MVIRPKIPNGFRPVRDCSREIPRWYEASSKEKRMGEPPNGFDGYRAAKQPHDFTTGELLSAYERATERMEFAAFTFDITHGRYHLWYHIWKEDLAVRPC
jgi:hypothetical protein